MKKPKQRQDSAALAGIFQALSDETRLRLLMALQAGEQNVSALCQQLKMAQPTASHHLGLLRLHGLVQTQRKGKQVFYSVDKAKFTEVRKAIAAFLHST